MVRTVPSLLKNRGPPWRRRRRPPLVKAYISVSGTICRRRRLKRPGRQASDAFRCCKENSGFFPDFFSRRGFKTLDASTRKDGRAVGHIHIFRRKTAGKMIFFCFAAWRRSANQSCALCRHGFLRPGVQQQPHPATRDGVLRQPGPPKCLEGPPAKGAANVRPTRRRELEPVQRP